MTNTTFTTHEQRCNEVAGGQTSLEFATGDAAAKIRVQRTPQTGPARVLVWDSAVAEWVIIQGAALRALGDAIATLPAEAFVDPQPAWTEGDIVVFLGTDFTSTWTRDAIGEWTGIRARPGSAKNGPDVSFATGTIGDQRIETLLSEPGFTRVLRRGGVNVDG